MAATGSLKSYFKKAQMELPKNSKLLQNVGEIIVSSVQRSIDVGGRYKSAGSFEGGTQKFVALTASSASYKKSLGKSPTNFLRQTGRLRSSITYEIKGGKLFVGSNVVYAGIHQFGGKIRITPKSRAFFRYKAATAKNPAQKAFWAGMAKSKGGFNMPARPFMTIQQEDLADIAEVVSKFYVGELV